MLGLLVAAYSTSHWHVLNIKETLSEPIRGSTEDICYVAATSRTPHKMPLFMASEVFETKNCELKSVASRLLVNNALQDRVSLQCQWNAWVC